MPQASARTTAQRDLFADLEPSARPLRLAPRTRPAYTPASRGGHDPAAKTGRAQVLDALRAGPKTDEEICIATRMQGSTVRPRRLELVHRGLIEDSGEVRPTEHGRPAIVWRLVASREDTRCSSV